MMCKCLDISFLLSSDLVTCYHHINIALFIATICFIAVDGAIKLSFLLWDMLNVVVILVFYVGKS